MMTGKVPLILLSTGGSFCVQQVNCVPLDLCKVTVYSASTSVVVAQWLIIFSTGDSG